jgi:hypothetical protein
MAHPSCQEMEDRCDTPEDWSHEITVGKPPEEAGAVRLMGPNRETVRNALGILISIHSATFRSLESTQCASQSCQGLISEVGPPVGRDLAERHIIMFRNDMNPNGNDLSHFALCVSVIGSDHRVPLICFTTSHLSQRMAVDIQTRVITGAFVVWKIMVCEC